MKKQLIGSICGAVMLLSPAAFAKGGPVLNAVGRAAVKNALEADHINVHTLKLKLTTATRGTLTGTGSTNPGAFPEKFKGNFSLISDGGAVVTHLKTTPASNPKKPIYF